MTELDTLDPVSHAGEARGVLSGRRAWLITSGKAGMLTQAKGVADALGMDSILKTVAPRGLWRLMAPWGPVSPIERFGMPGSAFAPPWPDIAIAVGRDSIPYIRRLRREAGRQCYTVVLQDPRSHADTADLIWVPAHDRRRGANVVTTVISPHGFAPTYLDTLRQHSAPEIDALPAPHVVVILGGPNAVYRYTEDDDARLATALGAVARLGVSFLISTSRRTHPGLVAAVDRATATAPRILWRSEADGPNPLADFLARGDVFIVTADSVNMTGEVAATGRPLYVYHPSGGSPKFQRYHQSLEQLGVARRLPDTVEALESWTYRAQVSAPLIAAEIERRYFKRLRNLAAIGP